MKNDLISKTLHDWRINTVLSHANGKLLDIACGDNMLAHTYKGDGIGVDVQQWGNVDIVVEDSSKLPFPDNSFNTITIVASLNYLSNRTGTFSECQRVLTPGGQLITTTISEAVGKVWSKIRGLDNSWDDPLTLKGIQSGINPMQAKNEIREAGMKIVSHKRFMLGLNNIIIAKKN